MAKSIFLVLCMVSLLCLSATASIVTTKSTGLSFLSKQIRASKRCGECTSTEDCESPLECTTDAGYCELPDDSYICDDSCCKRCSCVNTKNCVIGPSGPCTDSCQCIGDLECSDGVCNAPVDGGGNKSRCEACGADTDCNDGLKCSNDVCLLSTETVSICSSTCCLVCGCSSTANCRKPLGSSCISNCECLEDSESGESKCSNGFCVDRNLETPSATHPPSCSSCAELTVSPTPTRTVTSSPTPRGATATPAFDTGTPSATPTNDSTDCYPADGIVRIPSGTMIHVKDLKEGDLVFDGKGFTRVVVNVHMRKGSNIMMYINNTAIATVNHFSVSDLKVLVSREYRIGKHDSIYLLFTESRYIQVHGIRIRNYISTYPVWIQEIGIQMVQRSRWVREVLKRYRPTQAWHDVLCRLARLFLMISY